MNTLKPTDAAMKAARQIVRDFTGGGVDDCDVAQYINRETSLPALHVVALAAQGVVDAGRPHGSDRFGEACGCECCETFDTLKSAVDALEVVK